MSKAKMIVFTAAHDGGREALDRWYDERHVPDLLAVPGLVAAERYDVRALKTPPGSPAWDFLAVYSLDGDDIDAILREAAGRMGGKDMAVTPALDSAKTLALVVTEKAPAA